MNVYIQNNFDSKWPNSQSFKTMTTTSSPAKETSQEDANITAIDPNVLSDVEEDLTFFQFINRYSDDSMFSTSLLDNSSFENTPSYQSTVDDDTIYTQSRNNY